MNNYACKRTEIPSADNNLFYFSVPLQQDFEKREKNKEKKWNGFLVC